MKKAVILTILLMVLLGSCDEINNSIDNESSYDIIFIKGRVL